MLISVILPTFNSSATLKRCLNSIFEQDYKMYEIWAIDNASKDNTLEILKFYASNHTQIHIVSEPDSGIYDAMNKGINFCNGDWLYFMGSDDTLYAKDVLSKIAEKIKGCTAKVVYGNVVMRGENKWNLNNVVFDGEYNLSKVVNRNICHQAIFYHKTIFELCGNYNIKYIIGADHEFNLRCYAKTTFAYVDVIIANFFVGGHSTYIEDKQFHRDRGAILFKYFKKRLFNRSFLNSRLYIQKAALSKESPLNIWERIFCLSAYLKLKFDAVLIKYKMI